MGISFLLGKARVANPPLKIWIEVTSNCNLHCTKCPNHLLKETKNRFLKKDELLAILNKIPEKTREINLFHRGEPFLHTNICDFIRIIKNKNKFVRIYTNGTLLDKKERISSLLHSGLDLLAFSLPHPFSEEKDSKKHFERSIKNLEKILAEKKHKKLKKPYIKIESLSLGRCQDKKAKKYLTSNFRLQDIQKIAFRHPHNWAGNIDNPALPYKGLKYSQCTFPWYGLVILVDGTVTPCPQDFLGNLRLGNIFEDDMEDIWNGSPLMELRKKHAKGNLTNSDLCIRCDRIYRKTFLKVPLEYARIFWEK